MSSLCFYEAVEKRRDNEITEDVYLQSIVAHSTGVRHGKNRMCNNDTTNDDREYVSFAHDIKAAESEDRFAIKMSSWVFNLFNKNPLRGKHSNLYYGLVD
jgi:hypothetical protein